MEKEYGSCNKFDTIYCPEKNNEMMRELISKTTLSPNIKIDLTEGLLIGDKVNEVLCSNCSSFRENIPSIKQ